MAVELDVRDPTKHSARLFGRLNLQPFRSRCVQFALLVVLLDRLGFLGNLFGGVEWLAGLGGEGFWLFFGFQVHQGLFEFVAGAEILFLFF